MLQHDDKLLRPRREEGIMRKKETQSPRIPEDTLSFKDIKRTIPSKDKRKVHHADDKNLLQKRQQLQRREGGHNNSEHLGERSSDFFVLWENLEISSTSSFTSSQESPSSSSSSYHRLTPHQLPLPPQQQPLPQQQQQRQQQQRHLQLNKSDKTGFGSTLNAGISGKSAASHSGISGVSAGNKCTASSGNRGAVTFGSKKPAQTTMTTTPMTKTTKTTTNTMSGFRAETQDVVNELFTNEAGKTYLKLQTEEGECLF